MPTLPFPSFIVGLKLPKVFNIEVSGIVIWLNKPLDELPVKVEEIFEYQYNKARLNIS